MIKMDVIVSITQIFFELSILRKINHTYFHQPVSHSLNDRLKSVARNKWRETSVARTRIIIRSNARLLWRCAICTTHYGLQFPQSNKFLCTAPKVNSSYFPLNCKKSLEFQMSLCFFSSLRDVLLSLFSTYDSTYVLTIPIYYKNVDCRSVFSSQYGGAHK